MLYENLDDIPRDCEVPYEKLLDDELLIPEQDTNLSISPNLESSVDDLLDWD